MFKAMVMGVILGMVANIALAQNQVWIQIEARATMDEAQNRAAIYAGRLDQVAGYALGNGFHAIALGPYDPATARGLLAQLRATRAIPPDSYIHDGRRFKDQFWPPIGESAKSPDAVTTEAAQQGPLPVETAAQARRSEAALPFAARTDLQRALAWEGFYDGPIDGAFGRATRTAMDRWQLSYAHPVTGVLTIRQRAQLMEQYNSILAQAGMAQLRDDTAGIALQMPTDLVSFSEYRPPFAIYDGTADLPAAQVILISQPGTAQDLRGLYELLQVLDVIPPDGPRNLGANAFRIEGQDRQRHSFATATLQGGAIKGFALIWPAGDDRRRARLLQAMQDSFTALPAILDPDLITPGPDQSPDLLAGLTIRQPRLTRSGIYINATGVTITTALAVQDCSRITLDRHSTAEVALIDPQLGLAILRPLDPLRPLGTARFQRGNPRLRDLVTIAGYAFDGALPAPTLTQGRVQDLRDLSGDDGRQRLTARTTDSQAGGPVIDASGGLLGMLLERKTAGEAPQLPETVQFGLTPAAILNVLAPLGIDSGQTDTGDAMHPVNLEAMATDITALVECW